MVKSKQIVQPLHIKPNFLFLLHRSKKEIFRWFLVPYVFDFNYYKKFKLNKWQQQ